MGRIGSKRTPDKFWIVASAAMILKLILHFSTNTHYALHRDEMLYFNMADHPAFGYASVPPMIGWLAWIVKTLFGYSVFGIRFFPALLGVASLFLVAKTVKDLGGGLLALIIAASAFVFSTGFLLFDTLFTPNVLEQFLWLLLTYLIFRMTRDDNPRLWLWIGLVTGLAFLTKYSIVFFAGGFVLALGLSAYRRLFRSRYFAFALILALLLALPNILWQFGHGLPVIHHLQELKRTQMAHMNYLFFLSDLFSLNSLSTGIWLFGLLALLFFKQERPCRYTGIAALLIILLILFSNGKGYYVLGLLPFLFAAGGYALEKYTGGKRRWIAYAVLIPSWCFSLLALPYGIPLLSFPALNRYSEKTSRWVTYPFSRWEDGRQYKISQVYSDMTGWRELAALVAKAYHRLPKMEQTRCTIFAERNYGYAGAIHFYGKAWQLPDAITFLDSYILWAPDTIPNGPFIYIDSAPGQMPELFEQVLETGRIENAFFRENGLKVYLCTAPKTDVPGLYRKLVAAEKGVFKSSGF